MTHTQTQGADGAGTKTAATAWLLKRLKAARSDSEAHPEGHSNRTFYAGQAIAYENVLSLLEDEESTPAPAATPGVPDSLREAFAAATDSPVFVHDFADPAVSSAPGCQDVSLSFVTPDHITAAFMGNGLAGTIDQARKDAVALAAAWNHVRALIAAQPAGQSEGRLSREREIVSTWDRDIAPGLDRLEAIARRMGAPVGTRLIHWAADKLEEFGGRPAGQSNPDLTDWRNAERAPLGKVRTVLLKDAQPAGQAGDAGAETERLREAVSKALHDNQFLDDWREMVDPVVDAALAARPEAPSDAGWSFDMEAAPRDGTPINVGRDNGCGWDLLVVWWSKSATKYPWHTEGGGEYPEHRFDCWATLTPPSDRAPSGQAEG